MDYKSIYSKEGNLHLEGIENFNFGDTLDSGQCFRWKKTDENQYSGIAYNRLLKVSLDNQDLVLHNTTTEEFDAIWCRYFDLSRDYSKLKTQFNKDAVLKQAIEFCPGVRVLHQETWEALCSFIISANNNIPRIKGIIERFCQSFGEEIQGGYSFPKPESIANLTPEDLAPIRAGFRAKYLIDAAQKVAAGELLLEPLLTLPIDIAQSNLERVKGVGPKVANCVLLYGCGRVECIPIDVWIKRVLTELYPTGKLPDYLMPYAGLAQHFLFHYIRNRGKL